MSGAMSWGGKPGGSQRGARDLTRPWGHQVATKAENMQMVVDLEGYPLKSTTLTHFLPFFSKVHFEQPSAHFFSKSSTFADRVCKFQSEKGGVLEVKKSSQKK